MAILRVNLALPVATMISLSIQFMQHPCVDTRLDDIPVDARHDVSAAAEVPQLDGFVVRARHNDAVTELQTCHAVCVITQCH